jgi:hypothetical protein
MVRGANGAWIRRDVQVGLVSNTHAAIREGLKPGEAVALEPPNVASPDKDKSSTKSS